MLGSTPSDEDVECAAAIVDHAFGGDAPAVRIEPRLHRCVGRFRFLRTIALWVQVSISVFEEPSWCGASGCGDPKVVLTFGLPVFPKALTASAELGCLIMMGSFMMLRALSLRADPSAFIAQRSNLVQVALLGLSFTVIVLDVLLGDVGTGFFASAFNPVPPAVIRPFLFLAYSRSMRRLFWNVMRIVPRLLEVLLLPVCLVLFYGCLGVFLFRDVVFIHDTDEANAFFSTFPDAFWNMFILLTTANNPDVMIPAYTHSRLWSVYFISFLVIGWAFLLNLVLATVYDAYKSEMARSGDAFHAARNASLRNAFQLLTPHPAMDVDLAASPRTRNANADRWHAASEDGNISRATMRRLLLALRRFHRVPRIAEHSVELMLAVLFATIDTSHTGTISSDEFSEICTVLQLKFFWVEKGGRNLRSAEALESTVNGWGEQESTVRTSPLRNLQSAIHERVSSLASALGDGSSSIGDGTYATRTDGFGQPQHGRHGSRFAGDAAEGTHNDAAAPQRYSYIGVHLTEAEAAEALNPTTSAPAPAADRVPVAATRYDGGAAAASIASNDSDASAAAHTMKPRLDFQGFHDAAVGDDGIGVTVEERLGADLSQGEEAALLRVKQANEVGADVGLDYPSSSSASSLPTPLLAASERSNSSAAAASSKESAGDMRGVTSIRRMSTMSSMDQWLSSPGGAELSASGGFQSLSRGLLNSTSSASSRENSIARSGSHGSNLSNQGEEESAGGIFSRRRGRRARGGRSDAPNRCAFMSQLFLALCCDCLRLLFPHANTSAGASAEQRCSFTAVKGRLRSIMSSATYELFICVVVVVNFLVLLDVLEEPGEPPRYPWLPIELLFTAFFTVESVLAIAVYGCKRWFRSRVRLYNSVVAFIATCLELYVVLPTSFNDLNSIRYILLLRTLRIFFFVVSLPRFRRIGRTLARLQQPFGVVLAFLVLIVALFASVGVHVFGGAIYVGSKALAGSDFEAAGYAAMNFNDFPSALVTVFALLVMNNWFVIMDGVCLGVGSDWARVYFLVFYFVAVNIAFNTLVSVFLAITSSSGAAAETPVHTIAITKRVEESERAPLKQNQGRWRADSIASDEQSRDEASTAAALEEEQDASAQTFTVQAFRRARSHSLLFEIMSQT